MSRGHVIVLLALLVLALPSSTAFAQGPVPGTSRQGRIADDIPACEGAPGGSRVRTNCPPESTATSIRTTQEFKLPVEAHSQTNALCEVAVRTDYLQWNKVARVNGTLSIKNCPTGSTGSYNLVVRIKDASGEIKPLEFSAKWEQSDAKDVRFKDDYPIGENVDLLDVRVRNLRCTCADSAKEQANTPSDN